MTIRRRSIITLSIALSLLFSLGFVQDARAKSQHQANTKAVSSSTTASIDLLKQQWTYMPGATRQPAGLRFSATDFRIVEQDGTGGQANPPVNLYGTHFKATGDFQIDFSIKDIAATAALQVYGKVPAIQDEFRVEPPSIRLEVTPNTFKVLQWDGSIRPNLAQSLPVASTSFNFTPTTDGSTNIRLQKVRGRILLSVNGKQLGTVAEHGIFNSGEAWFGANGMGGSFLLTKLSAQALHNSRLQTIDTSKIQVARNSGDLLQTLAAAKRPGFLVGAAMALEPAVADNHYSNLAFGGQFGSMTTENALKWQFVEPAPQQFDFHNADALVDFASRHNLKVHGHTLVFSEANPKWVQDLPTATADQKAQVKQTMLTHISTVVGHFKGRIASWDVVNEPVADYDYFDASSGQILRSNKWLAAMGPSYIATAFNAAHQADPGAKLFVNEYGLEANGERWDAFLALMGQLKQQGVPVDGVGFEAHVYTAGDKIDPVVLKSHIEQLAKLGLVSRVSEMDVYDDDGIQVQTQQYSAVLNACLSEPSCVSWTTWGVTDHYDMFQDDNFQLQYGHDLLWSDRYAPTPALKNLFTTLH